MKNDNSFLRNDNFNKLNKALEQIEQSLSILKNMYDEVLPEELMNKNLDVVLENLCSTVSNSTKTTIKYSYKGSFVVSDFSIKEAVFKIITELLYGFVIDQKVKRIKLAIIHENDFFLIHLCNKDRLINSNKNMNQRIDGLKIIQHYINSIGGSYTVKNNNNSETDIYIKFPLKIQD